MTHLLPSQAARRLPGDGFWRKTWAMLVKEFIQLRRDRVSFAMIILIPLVQLMLFGYAINTMPRNLPTAVLMQERTDLSRSILGGARKHKISSRSRSCRIPKPRSISCLLRARFCSPSRFRPISNVLFVAATSRRCLSLPTPPIPWPPAPPLVRLVRCCRWRSHMTEMFRTRRLCHSRSAPIPATTPRA